jgi:hypothetical protein
VVDLLSVGRRQGGHLVRRIALGLAATSLGMLGLSGCSTSAPGATAGAVGASSNGVAGLDPAQILQTARVNARAQSSVHVDGTGSCAQAGRFSAEMALRSDGTGAGIVTTGSGKAHLIATPGALYVKADAAFWRTQTSAAGAAKAATRWVSFAPTTNTCFAALGSFASVLSNYLDLPGTPSKENSASVHGVPAQLVSIPPDIAVWVTTTGTPLPTYVSAPSADLGITFRDWGAPVEVTVPESSDVVDGTSVIAP